LPAASRFPFEIINIFFSSKNLPCVVLVVTLIKEQAASEKMVNARMVGKAAFCQ
jgi:hypothetical protein